MDPPPPQPKPQPQPPPRALPVPPLAPPVLLTPEVWEVIAGAVAGEIADADAVPDPSVRIPAVGAEVRYLPRRHASSSAQFPEYIDCYVHGVLLLADPVTLELLAQVTLSRHPPQHPAPAAATADPVRFFSKALSPSDVANHRIAVGRPGKRLFGSFRPAKGLAIRDVFGTSYVLRRNKHCMIAAGWPNFAKGKVMRTGDRVVFMRRRGGFLIGLRRFFSQEELEMARAPEQDVLHLVDRLQGGELVTLTWYPGRSGTFLVEPEPEVHTPPPSDSEEDEVPSVAVLSSGSETDVRASPPAQLDAVDSEEHEVPSIVSGDSEDDCAIINFSGQPVDPDFPARKMRLAGIPVPRGLQVKVVELLFTPVRGQRARWSGSSIVSNDSEEDYTIGSFSGQPADPDFPARKMRLAGIPVPRGLQVKGVKLLFTSVRGQRARWSGTLEPVTVTFESFLEETEAQAHTPPPALVDLVVSEEDEDQTPPPAQVDPVDSGEDDVHSVVIVSSASEAGYAIASFSGGQPVDPDYPAHNMRLSGVAVPRGYRLRGVTFQFSPLRGQRARRSVSSSG